ncbi:hypothetical protein HMPREF9425_0973 [Streptococcus vestibularis ATCC 49124]|uniref:Transposase IS204/IS1001/IS1096/IS1165 DDE domain-containing protein n=1 Tax=Streptococcus vestibularis ATCC 49124 TaxID=889206 RepID=A0ABN0CGT4_STRVE|nr:hypothetical protein HMPREF9425_0973 [Streptococcus vestibularis ATCC 49124]
MLFHFQEKRVDEFFELIEENISKVNYYFKTVFRTFLRHKPYIKNALETHYSNAKLEGTNKLIKDIKRLGFGFRNFINFRKRVFITLNIKKRRPIRSSLDVSFSSPTTVDKEPIYRKKTRPFLILLSFYATRILFCVPDVFVILFDCTVR